MVNGVSDFRVKIREVLTDCSMLEVGSGSMSAHRPASALVGASAEQGGSPVGAGLEEGVSLRSSPRVLQASTANSDSYDDVGLSRLVDTPILERGDPMPNMELNPPSAVGSDEDLNFGGRFGVDLDGGGSDVGRGSDGGHDSSHFNEFEIVQNWHLQVEPINEKNQKIGGFVSVIDGGGSNEGVGRDEVCGLISSNGKVRQDLPDDDPFGLMDIIIRLNDANKKPKKKVSEVAGIKFGDHLGWEPCTHVPLVVFGPSDINLDEGSDSVPINLPGPSLVSASSSVSQVRINLKSSRVKKGYYGFFENDRLKAFSYQKKVPRKKV